MTPERWRRVEVDGRVIVGIDSGEGISVCDRLGGQPTGEVVPKVDVDQVLCPVTPSKIVAVALNYRAHAAEMKKEPPAEPMFFLKPVSALVADGGTIRLPPGVGEVHHEAELGIVIGKKLTRASKEEAEAGIFGLTIVNDVTARELQRKQNHYTRAKGYDTFCPVGPVIVTGVDWRDLAVTLDINGERRQSGRTSDLIFDVGTLLSFISTVMTLEPGDLVSTGTPSGVGPIRAGDRIRIDIEHVGVQVTTVEAG